MKKILLIFLIALFMSVITACNASKKISEEQAKQIALTRAEEIDKFSRTYIVHEVSKGSESSKPVWMINLINDDKTSVSSSLWFYIDAKTGKILMVNGY
ncbi:PepSY domain-containing protein [Paenibacillus harenae]|uniref:Membrane protein YkoI n=1 Tax=Paenibacillus harenae TaxID=306543 RepID=A0ABT9TZ27_PAEHA|nr:PepSY domain-containing protein [Paenibacillus harenae]MDQ0112563.1 putative membrane protein YkoI [Paenibacillus harenae]